MSTHDDLAGRRIHLDEASGPVSPRFQYSLAVDLATDGDACAFDVRSKNGPLGTRDDRGTASLDSLRTLIATLDAAPLVDLMNEEREKRVGVRVSTLSIEGGARPRSVRFLASDLRGDEPGQKALQEARDAILAFVKAL